MFRTVRLFIALLLTIAALPLLAEDSDDRFELKYGKDFAFHGGRVSIDHGFGALTVRTHAGSTVQVRATIRSSSDEIGKQIRVVASEGAGGVSIRTEFPEIRHWRGQLSYSVDMTVTVPAQAPVTAKNQFGSIDARGLQAASVFENRQGSVVLQDARGAQKISNSFGSIDVAGVRGELAIQNGNGSVTVRRADGPLTVQNRFGSIDVADIESATTLTNANGSIQAVDIRGSLKVTNAFGSVKASTIGGPVDITNGNARVDLSNISGAATVHNSFGTVSATSVRGDLTVEAGNGRVEATDITGNADIETSFGAIALKNVTGTATLASNNGTVRASDIGGSVKVRASFGGVFLEGIGGAIDVTNGNGAVSVSGLRGKGCNPISLRTNFSSIRIALPESASYALSARTSFGRIHTDVPITTRTVGEENVSGTIGKGGCRLELVNANGNITIDKE